MVHIKECKADTSYLNIINIYLWWIKSGGDTFHYC